MNTSPRRLVSLAAILALVVPLGMWQAGAQVVSSTTQQVPPVDEPSSTTTTAPPASTTTTAPSRSTTTTTAPSQPSSPPGDGGGGDGGEPTPGPRVVPPEAQARINAYPRSKANNTKRLLAALAPLVEMGFSPEQAAVVGFGRFPVAGDANFVNDWMFPRWNPEFRFHEGTDVFAPTGTPLISPTEGTLTRVTGNLGGQGLYIHQDDGTYFYFAHLSAYADSAPHDSRVKVGDVVGFVGDSGDAKGGSPHLHIQIHPAPVKEIVTGRGKNRKVEYKVIPVSPGTRLAPIDPKPYLDRWLDEAMERAAKVVASYSRARPGTNLRSALPPSPIAAPASVFAGPAGPTQSELLWASAANPAGGALAVAEAEAARLAASVDWDARAKEHAARLTAWDHAETRARQALTPLTPVALIRFL